MSIPCGVGAMVHGLCLVMPSPACWNIGSPPSDIEQQRLRPAGGSLTLSSSRKNSLQQQPIDHVIGSCYARHRLPVSCKARGLAITEGARKPPCAKRKRHSPTCLQHHQRKKKARHLCRALSRVTADRSELRLPDSHAAL